MTQKASRQISAEQAAEWLAALAALPNNPFRYDFNPYEASISGAGQAVWSFDYNAWVVSGSERYRPRIASRIEDAIYLLIQYERDWMQRANEERAKELRRAQERVAWCEATLEQTSPAPESVLYATGNEQPRTAVCVVGKMPADTIQRALADASKEASRNPRYYANRYFDDPTTIRHVPEPGSPGEDE